MFNKSVLLVVAAQTVVIIGLLYLIWNQKSNELILNKYIILIIAILSVVLVVVVIFLLIKNSILSKGKIRKEGTVKWFSPSKGFGFIEQDIGDDLFVHQSEIRQAGFRYLNIGDRVEYEVGSGKKGPVALKIIRTKPADPEKYETYVEKPDVKSIGIVS